LFSRAEGRPSVSEFEKRRVEPIDMGLKSFARAVMTWQSTGD